MTTTDLKTAPSLLPEEATPGDGVSRQSKAAKAERLRLLTDENYDASGDNQERNPLHSNLWPFVLWCVVLLTGSVGWGFQLNMIESKVAKREQFLSTLKYRYLYIQAELIEHERFSSIQRKSQDFNLGLELSSAPPYEVFIPENK